MNLSKLCVGLTIENYKKMCELLGEEEKSSNSKKAQLKEWKKYFDWTHSGHKFIITAIYDNPLEILDDRIVYNNYIQKLILDLLVQQLKTGKQKIYLSTGKFFESICMTNTNYSFCKDYIPELAIYLDTKEDYIFEFYMATQSTLKYALESGLKTLADKALVSWHTCTTVVQPYTDNNKDYIIHRPATDEERSIILRCENEIMVEMGFKSKKQILMCKRWKEYNKKVIKLLNKQEYSDETKVRIHYYYKSYDVVFLTNVIQERNKVDKFILEQADRKLTKISFNTAIIDKLQSNTQNRQNKATKKKDKVFVELSKAEKIRVNDNFTVATDKIINTLVKVPKEDISDDLLTIKYGIDKDDIDVYSAESAVILDIDDV